MKIVLQTSWFLIHYSAIEKASSKTENIRKLMVLHCIRRFLPLAFRVEVNEQFHTLLVSYYRCDRCLSYEITKFELWEETSSTKQIRPAILIHTIMFSSMLVR